MVSPSQFSIVNDWTEKSNSFCILSLTENIITLKILFLNKSDQLKIFTQFNWFVFLQFCAISIGHCRAVQSVAKRRTNTKSVVKLTCSKIYWKNTMSVIHCLMNIEGTKTSNLVRQRQDSQDSIATSTPVVQFLQFHFWCMIWKMFIQTNGQCPKHCSRDLTSLVYSSNMIPSTEIAFSQSTKIRPTSFYASKLAILPYSNKPSRWSLSSSWRSAGMALVCFF